MSSFSRSTSINRRAFNSPRTITRKSSISQSLCGFVIFGSVALFFIAITSGYLYVLPNLSQTFNGFNSSMFDCDVFDGHWIRDGAYPLYNASECPFIERGFNCLGNGRINKDYLKWRWKPRNCDISRFNVYTILKRLRGKRVVFVGDSMSRTQWESLVCLLMTGVEDKGSVYEVNKNNITKQIRHLCVRFASFNFTVEFFRSVFLVEIGWLPKNVPKRVRSTLKLDRLDNISREWINSDVIVFNTGQWWMPGKLFEMGSYFQIGSTVRLGISIPAAYKVALATWSTWVETMVNTNRTRVFFRTFEPSHWSDRSHKSCDMGEYRAQDIKGSIFSDIVSEVVKNMTVPVTVLGITSMSSFRGDAHVGNWSFGSTVPDCSHWCLPGLPDIWNEIALSFL